MKKELYTIRGIDKDVYRKFKEKALEERLPVGKAMTLAMKEWIKREEKKEKLNPKNLLKIKPFDWAKAQKELVKKLMKSSMVVNDDNLRY